MDPDLNLIEQLQLPDEGPTAQQVSRQRDLLFESIRAEGVRSHSGSWRSRIRRHRVGGIVCLTGLAFSLGGGGVGWALADPSSPSPASSPSSPVVISACSASGTGGQSITYVVEGTLCEPGRVPAPGHLAFSSSTPPTQYCALSGVDSSPQNEILVIGASECPTGYSKVTTSTSP